MQHTVRIQSTIRAFSPTRALTPLPEGGRVTPVWLQDYDTVVAFFCRHCCIMERTSAGSYLEIHVEGVIRIDEFALMEVHQHTPLLNHVTSGTLPLFPLSAQTDFEMIALL